MPRIYFDSEIMQSSTSFENSPDKVVCPKSAFIFDNSHEFDAAYGMFYPYPERRNFPVVFFFFWGKHPAFGLFYGLHNGNIFRIVALITGILIQYAGGSKGIHRISYFFVVHLSANTITDKQDKTAGCNDNPVFQGMFLFLSAVVFFLFIIIHRTGNLPLGAVMQQNGRFFIRWETLEKLRELLLCFCRHYSRIMQTFFKNMAQNMDKPITMLLIHIETSRMIFLKRIIFQVNQDEEQAVFDRRKRTVTVYGKTPTTVSKLAVHIVFCEILIMRLLKVWKQFAELFRRNSGQRTETFFLMVIIVIIHATKIRARV